MLLFLAASNYSFMALGNMVLKIWYGIILLSLPVSIFFSIIVLFWLQLFFSFATITEHILLEANILKVTISTCFLWLYSVLFHKLHLFCHPYSYTLFEVIQLATSLTHLLIGRTLLRWMSGSAVFAFLLRWWSVHRVFLVLSMLVFILISLALLC